MTIKRNDLMNCYKVLELSEDASWAEIRKSYCNLKELYSRPTIATLSINEDMLDKQGVEILVQIDEAYQCLEKHFKDTRLKNEKKIEQIVSKVVLYNGNTLKKVREMLNIDLSDIALASNIQINHLKNIENELIRALPNDVYLRGYLVNYAEFLSLDSQKVVDDYMLGYRQWREKT